MEKVLGNVVDITQCGPKVLGLIFFLNRRHIPSLFKISSIGIYTQAFARSHGF
jgi:hypothetical protein